MRNPYKNVYNPFRQDLVTRALTSAWVYVALAAVIVTFGVVDLSEHHYLSAAVDFIWALTALVFVATRRAARLRAEYDGRRAVLDSAHDVGIDTEYGEWEDWYLAERLKATRALVAGLGEPRFRK